MSIEYSLVERGNPGNSNSAKKWYAVARSQGETTVRDIASRINQMSTVSTIDVMAVLEAFFQTVPDELADGQIVRFGDFGSFSVSLQSDGADSEKEFTAANINNVKVVFRPGRLFAQAMQGASFRKASATLPNTEAQKSLRSGKKS
ncbi:HU family DNA-binding protein [Hymenobacter aerophilus]|uniref:HU family DNA-binding protein n=1 Tax=Hymenobacter aerophilus TaxID=119644 RepID=UPI00037A5EC8|nr:HU family DNA-binding protein [Hymenobacter aerophilus]